ncbi:MAG: potassium/proton antiporter, partial [Propionibacteriaceae bacterium]|nr:potassium/proton antiporter [Propionibacteriaceae bacterium]
MATKVGDRLGLPSLILFLGLGVVLSFDSALSLYDAQLAQDLGFAALVIILIEGGLSTKWDEIRPAIVPAILLASVGVVVTICLQGIFGYFVLGFPLAVAVLLAAILAPTDSAAVFSVLRHVPLPARVRSVLEGESGLNDAPTVLLVTVATQWALGTVTVDSSLWLTGALVVGELVGGIVFGLLFGYVGVQILRRLALPASGLYPLAVIGWAVASYGLGVVMHLSGFAAVYVCAVILGNGKLPHRHAARSFADGIAWIAQIGLFVMLGLLTHIWTITATDVLLGVLAGLFLTFIVRPLSVWLCTIPMKLTTAEKVFVSWG